MAMNGLFQRSGLEQDSGLLKERWQQEGSEAMSFTADMSASTLLHTVTAGKKFYMSGISISTSDSTGGEISIRDGGSAGTTKAYFNLPKFEGNAGQNSYGVPIIFETNVYMKEEFASNGNIIITGWEE